MKADEVQFTVRCQTDRPTPSAQSRSSKPEDHIMLRSAKEGYAEEAADQEISPLTWSSFWSTDWKRSSQHTRACIESIVWSRRKRNPDERSDPGE
jgi:hypothetical protein